jgi:hypothetical protein
MLNTVPGKACLMIVDVSIKGVGRFTAIGDQFAWLAG